MLSCAFKPLDLFHLHLERIDQKSIIETKFVVNEQIDFIESASVNEA